MSKSNDATTGCALIILLLLVFGVGIVWNYVLVDQVTVIVKDKNNVVDKHGNYLIFTQHEVFSNGDTWWRLKVNSSDFQNELAVGKTYEVTVCGLRVPLFSWYRNIVNYKPVE